MHLTLRARTLLRWVPVAFLAVVLARLVWLAWSAASRGIDFTDEGIYLVSYRYYRNPEMVYNGAPAFFGPLFHLFGYSVVSLRRIKLVLVLICGLGLGRATSGFVDHRGPESTRIGAGEVRLAIVLFVAIGGFTMYTWLPQSPGYNDLSVLCATALAATILPVLGDRSSARHRWLTAAGAVVAIALINKWPAAVCMVIVVGVALILARGWRRAGSGLGWAAAGFVLCCGLLAVLSGSFFDRLTELRSASEQLSASLPVWDSYLLPYWQNVVEVAGLVGAKVWLVLALGVGLALVVPPRRAMVLGATVGLGVLLAVKAAWRAGEFRGGDVNVASSQVALPLLLVLAAVIWLIARVAASLPVRGHDGADQQSDERTTSARAGVAAVTLLVGLGGAQAFGTLNPPMYVVVSSGALCAGVIVIAAFNSVRSWRPAMLPMAALLVVLPIAVERMVLSGVWQRPYRLATNLYAQTEQPNGAIGEAGLSVDSGTAELLQRLSEIADRRSLAGRPGLSVSSSPGYALALGLTHPPADLFVSAAEYGKGNFDIYDARLRTACSRGLINRDDPPVILTAGSSAPADIAAVLADCGIAFPADFDLEVAESPVGSVGVWIPSR